MVSVVNRLEPLVSVIIPCYNHGRYLARAIESVQRQTHSNIEIIVIDDGSTDNTRSVCARFPDVKYCYQKNAGLSAARNAGKAISHGDYLVFLDADDWLYPNGLSDNLEALMANPTWAFVSGDHDKVDADGNQIDDGHDPCNDGNHFRRLLEGNYIGMHATVMYRRIVFDEFKFDTSLKACEDYDLYLSVAKKYPVGCHRKKNAAYAIHGENMSSDVILMKQTVLQVLKRHGSVLTDPQDVQSYRIGIAVWQKYYEEKLMHALAATLKVPGKWLAPGEARTLLNMRPTKFVRYYAKKIFFESKEAIKRNLPSAMAAKLHRLGLYHRYTLRPGSVDMGDLDRREPFSRDFGYDRGGPIDRFYIENFLRENKNAIRGRVLEIGDNEYTLRFGDRRQLKSDVLHIDAANSNATIIGDITNLPEIPSGAFDCIILTQTLHLIYDFKKALQTCYRILKPGGTLLLTVPGITPIDAGIWKDYWLWSFTDTAMRKVMRETFNGSVVEVKSYGNVKVATAFLYGLGLPEIDSKSLRENDAQYQVIVSVKAIKSKL